MLTMMRWSRCIAQTAVLFLLLTAVPLISSTTSEEETKLGVIELDARSIDSRVGDGSVWLIEFYAPWCVHCNRFAPTYESIANTLHSQHDNNKEERMVMVAKVDGAKDRALSSRFGVKGFPCFFLVDGWTVRQYDGIRSKDDLILFATETFEEIEPIPFLNSPFGPLGQLRALLMFVGTKVLDAYDYLLSKGLSSTVAAMLMASIGIVAGLFSIIVIGLITLPKVKED